MEDSTNPLHANMIQVLPEDLYQRIKFFAKTILREERTSPEKTLNTPQILGKIGARFGEQFVPNKNTFSAFLSKAAKEKNSEIVLKARRQGFYYQEFVTVPEVGGSQVDLAESPPAPADLQANTGRFEKQKRRIEATLYPILKNWLIEEGYDSKVTDYTRAGGRWGNPDVTGIKFTENFDSSDLEIVTVEVKSTADNWEQLIFEAVAHRRFSNRTYFAFAVAEDQVNKLDADLRYYADLYRIGILVVELDMKSFEEFTAGKPLQTDLNAIVVNEIYSAPYNEIRAEYKKRFLTETLKISSIKELLRFFSDESDLDVINPNLRSAG